MRMTRLFLGLWAGLLPLSLSAQLVLAPMPNSQWPKRPLSFSDTIEAHTKIRQRLEQLQRRGYILSSADSLKFANDTLWVQLHQGKKWKWVLAESQQSNLLDLPQSLPLTPNSWTAIKEKALEELHAYGYAGARISLRPKQEEGQTLVIEVGLDLGPALVWDSITAGTERVLAPRVLQHFSGLYPNRPVQHRHLKEGVRSLSSAGLLDAGSTPRLLQRGTKVDVDWPLKKARTNRFSGILGMMPDNNQTGGFLLTGELDLALENTFGYAERLNVSWQRLQTATQQLKIEASWPYLFGSRLGCMGDFKLFRIDSAFSQLEGKAGLSWKPSGFSLISGFFHIRQSLAAPGAENPSAGWLDASALSVGLQWEKRAIDDPITPRKGYRIRAIGSTGNREFRPDTVGNLNNVLVSELELDAFILQPIYKQWICYVRGHGYWLNSAGLLRSETRRFGGLHSLRGVDEESLYATWFGYLNTEIRFIFDRGSWFHFFADAGRYGRELGNETQSEWQIGTGLGLTFLTPAGSFSVVYALGITPGTQTGFGQSKIHLGYQARW